VRRCRGGAGWVDGEGAQDLVNAASLLVGRGTCLMARVRSVGGLRTVDTAVRSHVRAGAVVVRHVRHAEPVWVSLPSLGRTARSASGTSRRSGRWLGRAVAGPAVAGPCSSWICAPRWLGARVQRTPCARPMRTIPSSTFQGHFQLRHEPTLGSSGSVVGTPRHRETGRPRDAQFAPGAVYIPGAGTT
jgi:hypothetical protein